MLVSFSLWLNNSASFFILTFNRMDTDVVGDSLDLLKNLVVFVNVVEFLNGCEFFENLLVKGRQFDLVQLLRNDHLFFHCLDLDDLLFGEFEGCFQDSWELKSLQVCIVLNARIVKL